MDKLGSENANLILANYSSYTINHFKGKKNREPIHYYEIGAAKR